MPLPIALQFYTVRDPLKQDVDGTIRQVARLGYTHAEIGPFGGKTTAELAAKCREAGLTPVASHEMALFDPAKADAAMNVVRDAGMKYAVQPWLGDDYRNADGYTHLASHLTSLTPPAGVAGVTVCYHNHDFEFETLPDGNIGWDYITSGNNLHAELDTCWVAIAGRDPVAEMRKLAGRVPLLHVKDCADFKAKTMTELGKGKVDVAAIVKAASECGVECLIVEQDNNWVDNDPIKSAGESLKYLKTLV